MELCKNWNIKIDQLTAIYPKLQWKRQSKNSTVWDLIIGCSTQTVRLLLVVGFAFFPSFVALVHKYLSYVECTRYSCNIPLIYIKIKVWQMATNTIQPWFLMLHQALLNPRLTNLSFIWLMCLPTMHAHRMGNWNVLIRPLLTEIWGGTVVGFWVVWGLGDIGLTISLVKAC